MKHAAIVCSTGFVLLLSLTAALAFACGHQKSLSRVAHGDDVLSVLFGDAREVLSRAAVHKADSYFHGGVEMDEGEVEKAGEGRDWWRWIDSRIQVPQEHRHLDGSDAVELMPWLWAAVRTDPHNAEAWSVAWYAAAHIMKDRAMAARVLAEAKAKNPNSIEIAFTEARALYEGGKGDLSAAKRAFERTVMLARAKGGEDLSRLTPREEEAFRFAGNYLKNMGTVP